MNLLNCMYLLKDQRNGSYGDLLPSN